MNLVTLWTALNAFEIFAANSLARLGLCERSIFKNVREAFLRNIDSASIKLHLSNYQSNVPYYAVKGTCAA